MAWSACLLSCLLLAAGPGPAPCTTDEANGTVIDWSAGWVTATGRALLGTGSQAEAQARRAAQADGYRNLLEALGGVTITVNQTVGEAAEASPDLKTRLDGYLQGARVIAQRVEPGPPAELVLTLMAPLRGESGLLAAVATERPEPPAAPPAPASPWTGLILDARQPADDDDAWPLLRPALWLTLLETTGAVLYGPDHVTDAVRRTTGNVVYLDVATAPGQAPLAAGDLPLGAWSDRVGEQPLCLPATPIAGGDSALYLSADAAARFRELDPVTVLGAGKVIVLRKSLEEP